MASIIFDHEKLDVYRLALEYAVDSFRIARELSGLHRHARDQWLRAAQSIPLNIAEGNGKRSLKDRSRFFDIAHGSALECAAIQDVLVVSGGIDIDLGSSSKAKLRRIVAMLTRLALPTDRVAESPTLNISGGGCDYDYEHDNNNNNDNDNEHEHRCAEHEQE
jgi:four helix bundle protein